MPAIAAVPAVIAEARQPEECGQRAWKESVDNERGKRVWKEECGKKSVDKERGKKSVDESGWLSTLETASLRVSGCR